LKIHPVKRKVLSAALAASSLILPPLSRGQTSDDPAEMTRRIAELTKIVQKLQARVEDLEGKLQASSKNETKAEAPAVEAASQSTPTQSAGVSPPPTPAQTSTDPLRGTTVNFLLDGYYGYNFNDPIGRVNLLRAYDVSSNAFSINQADVVLENSADPAHGNIKK